MQVVHERCCGLDVHKKTVVACLLTPGKGGRPARAVRTFGTTTKDLLALSDWLSQERCSHVAMESTGSYWKPVYNILEDAFEMLVVNAQHMKAVPGRKTDVKDADWIADLLRHGLLAPSFIPSRPERELRELTRYRTSLVQERSSEVNRLQKVLEGANIKLASVITNVIGLSGRTMLAALAAGNEDVDSIVELARGKARSKRDQLRESLNGHVLGHQRFLIKAQLRHIDELNALIDEVSEEIEQRLEPMKEDLERLITIPGVGPRTAQIFLSEVGNDMTRFPSARHLASWAGLCPGNNESAGKTRTGKIRKGSPWLKAVLVEAGIAAGRSNSYLGAQFRRLAARRGVRRAAVALAHTIIVIAYHMLTRKQDYSDLGVNYFDERQRDRLRHRLTTRLESLGYHVTVEAAA